MTLEFAPRSKLTDYLRAGWHLVAGHTYSPSDYAILVMRDEGSTAMTARQIQIAVAPFRPRQIRPRMSTMSAGHASWRCKVMA